MYPSNSDQSYNGKKNLSRQRSPQGLHKKASNFHGIPSPRVYLYIAVNLQWPSWLQIISLLLRPRHWKPPTNRRFFLDTYEIGELCYAAEQIFIQEPTVLQLKAPVKVFGDLHGQFGDLIRLFDEYGFPSTAGDIT